MLYIYFQNQLTLPIPTYFKVSRSPRHDWYVFYLRSLQNSFFFTNYKACGLKTIVANGIFASSSVFDPSILNWVTATFVLTIITQISATILIAARIYAASQPFQVSGEVPDHGYGVGVAAGIGKGGGRKYERTQREKYMAMVWVVVESGAIYSSAAIVQLVTTLEKMNAGVIMEFLLSQLSVSNNLFLISLFF